MSSMGEDELIKAILALRDEVAGYRQSIRRYARRGWLAAGATLASLLLLSFVLVASLYTSQTNLDILQQLDHAQEERAEVNEEHRTRNEQLHACLVDLMFAIITTERDGLGDIENPCPEPLTDAELSSGSGHNHGQERAP